MPFKYVSTEKGKVFAEDLTVVLNTPFSSAAQLSVSLVFHPLRHMQETRS
jgi:hypothetical protein